MFLHPGRAQVQNEGRLACSSLVARTPVMSGLAYLYATYCDNVGL